MSKKIIISKNYKKTNPRIAFTLSFFFTGLGQVYAGAFYRGTIYLLLKLFIILIPPFYAITNPDAFFLNTVFYTASALVSLIIINSIDALVKGIKNPETTVQKYNNLIAYILYGAAGTLLTIIFSLLFTLVFSFYKVPQTVEPIYEKNDLVLVSKIPGKKYTHGEPVLIQKQSGMSIKRIIAIPGEKAEYKNSRFLVDGSELMLSIFSEAELKKMSLTSYDVISELNGFFKYSVKQSRIKFEFRENLKPEEYLTASDDRSEKDFHDLTEQENIYGRVEGIVFSPLRKKILIEPFISNR